MKFSTKSRYALRLMAELARYAPGSTVSLKEDVYKRQIAHCLGHRLACRLGRAGGGQAQRMGGSVAQPPGRIEVGAAFFAMSANK